MPRTTGPRPAPGQITTCPTAGCRAQVRYYSTRGGRWLALDVDPHPDGTVVLERAGPELVARILTGTELPALTTAYRPHSRTCAASPDVRRRGPRCHVCNGPMPADLARLERWATHPCCDPEHARILARWNNVLAREARAQGRGTDEHHSG